MASEVLVTGAYGFLGRHVARRFSADGWKVAGMGHGVWPREQSRQWGIEEWHTADVTLETLTAHASKPNLIVHCAGGSSVGFSMSDPYHDFQRTAQTTLAVLEYVRLHAPGASVVLPSSAAVYGAAKTSPINENTPTAPISPYGTHKQLAEELCRSYAASFGVAVAIVRLFSVYGAGLRKQLMWDAAQKLAVGDTSFAGTGEERRDWLHVSDAVELLMVAAKQASRECFVLNGGSGSARSVRDVVSLLATGFPRSGAFQFSGATRLGDPMHYEADVSRAIRLGWRPRVPLEEGIAQYLEWFKTGAA